MQIENQKHLGTRTSALGSGFGPWGKVLSSTEAVPNPYRYAGYRYDETTGLYYLNARYYSPTLLRLISKDNASANTKVAMSFNKYIYCEDNPVSRTDASGYHSRELHWTVTRDIVFEIATRYGFSEASAYRVAVSAANYDRSSDGRFKKCGGRHINMNQIGEAPSQKEFASSEMSYAIFLGKMGLQKLSLKHLGYGLHSAQDLSGHGPGVPRDDDLDESQKQAWKDTTRAYIKQYFAAVYGK